jgi:hypothetical protein
LIIEIRKEVLEQLFLITTFRELLPKPLYLVNQDRSFGKIISGAYERGDWINTCSN